MFNFVALKVIMPTPQGFLNVADIKADVGRAKAAALAAGQPFKLAVTVTGGGARGAYEAGVVEAILAERIAPDLIVGTSAGALVGFGMLIDSIFPKVGIAPFAGSQSLMWKKLAFQNQGASLAVSQPWLVDLATWKDVEAPIADVISAINVAVAGFTIISDELRAILKMYRDDSSAVSNAVNNTLNADIDTLGKLVTDVANVDLVNGSIHAARLITTGPAESVAALQAIINNTTTAITRIGNDLTATDSWNGTLLTAFTSVAIALGQAATAMTTLMKYVGLVAKATLSASPRGITDTLFKLTNSLMSLDPLKKTLLEFAVGQQAPNPRLLPPPPRSILDTWLSLTTKPEYICTTGDLHEERLVLFGLAHPETITKLVNSGAWYVDLAHGRTATRGSLMPTLSENLFVPDPVALTDIPTMNDQIIEAVLTSTSVPIAFEPRKWNLNRSIFTKGPRGIVSHAQQIVRKELVDGGVGTNSPIDIAMGAGATYIISIELGPLNHSDIPRALNVVPAPLFPDNIINIAGMTLSGAMNVSQKNSVQRLIQVNGARALNDPGRMTLVRLAPNIDDKTSIGMMDFDGKWDPMAPGQLIMGLYDWFMQGYIDAKGLTATSLTSDPLVIDYMHPANNGFKLNARDLNNGFWPASSVATPPLL